MDNRSCVYFLVKFLFIYLVYLFYYYYIILLLFIYIYYLFIYIFDSSTSLYKQDLWIYLSITAYELFN